jgi:acyl-CoA dehydrogenase
MNNTQRGRDGLRAWLTSKPDNFYTSDVNLQRVLRRYMGDTAYNAAHESLTAFGATCATIIDEAAKVEDHIGNHPRLERYNGIGERIESIEFHPNHDKIGRLVWDSGVLALQAAPGNTVHQMALSYLLTHNGEAGHACSLACTAGLIRALQQVGSEELKARFLPPLLERDYDAMQHGAQFLTEVQGGSDVGAIAVTAQQDSGGDWRINGEKWFCSNINADQFLILARANDQQGTRGLGLFLVPRKLDDGSINNFALRRLKDKLGTRTLASAELDFTDAVAYPVGAIEQGFKNAVELVLNTSRLMNAVDCAAVMRRAHLEAAHYACTRQAFGGAIIEYPLVQEALADLLTEYHAAVASSFALAHLVDRIDLGEASEDERGAYRMLVNLNKYITSIRGSEMVHRAIEVLGGNGAIESFSILPRLYRDMIVLESWEGTHNVLCAQVLRDIARYRIHEPFVRWLRDQLASITDARLQADKQVIEVGLEDALTLLDRLTSGGEAYAQAHMRRMVDAFAHAAQAVLLLSEAQWELQYSENTLKPDVIVYFVNKRVHAGYDPLNDSEYLDRLKRLAYGI